MDTKGEAGILPPLEQQNKHGHAALEETEGYFSNITNSLDLSVLCITY